MKPQSSVVFNEVPCWRWFIFPNSVSLEGSNGARKITPAKHPNSAEIVHIQKYTCIHICVLYAYTYEDTDTDTAIDILVY